MDDWTGSDSQIDALIADLPTYDAPDAAIAAVLSAVAAERAPAPVRPLRWPLLAAAAAALIAVGFGAATLRPEPPPALTIKGAAAPLVTPATVALGLSVLRDGAPVALQPGQQAQASDSVLLRYTTDRAGFAYLFRADGADVEVFHGVAAPAGTHHVTADGQVLGYPLQGLEGAQRFGLAWTAEPWPAGPEGPTPPTDLVAALSGGLDRDARLDADVGLVSVDVAALEVASP